MTKELFQHELCVNFQNYYNLSKEDAQQLHEVFAHLHNIMTDINGETLMNALWLQDNFFEKDGISTQEMIDKVSKYARKRSNINKGKGK